MQEKRDFLQAMAGMFGGFGGIEWREGVGDFNADIEKRTGFD